MLGAYPERAVPTACAECHAVSANTQTADSVFMARQHTHTLSPQRVPNVASPIVVTTEQNTARDRESNRSNAAQNIVMCKRVQFTISSDIKQAAGSVVGPCRKRITVGEKPGKEPSKCFSTSHDGRTYCTALISDSWPVNVCVARPLRISQSLAVASQAPETNTFWLGPRDKLTEAVLICEER